MEDTRSEYFDESSAKRLAALSIVSSSEESDSDPTDSDDSEDYDYDYESDGPDEAQTSDNSDDQHAGSGSGTVANLFMSEEERKEHEQREKDQFTGSAKTGPVLRPVNKDSNMMSIYKQLEREAEGSSSHNNYRREHRGRGRSRRKYEDEDEDEEDEEARARRSLLCDNTARNRSGRRRIDYASYKKRIIHPNTAFDLSGEDPNSQIPYTSDNEEARDARRAAELHTEISQIYSNAVSKRTFRTLERGMVDSEPFGDPLKSFLVASDLSPEANHALEWTIGTVLRDGDLLIVVCCFEDDKSSNSISSSPGNLSTSNLEKEARPLSGASSPDPLGLNNNKFTSDEQVRLRAMATLTNLTDKLLKKTRLQVRVVLEVLHCKNPRHMITEIIDHVNPTLVIVGSRGRSAIKGVLLGSFSNYVVERSSVPVMVARKKLQKAKNRDLKVRLANNLRVHKLADARID